MVVAILGVTRHLPANLFNGPTISVVTFEDLPKPIIEAFDFVEGVLWRAAAMFFVHVFDIMEVVEVVGEPPKGLRDFGLSVTKEAEEFGVLLSHRGEFAGNAKEEVAFGDRVVEFELGFRSNHLDFLVTGFWPRLRVALKMRAAEVLSAAVDLPIEIILSRMASYFLGIGFLLYL